MPDTGRSSRAAPEAICLLAEPIHGDAEALLTAGVTVRHGSSRELESVLDELVDVDAVIVRNALSAAAMDAAPRLAVIGNHGTGTDAVDLAHAARLGIPVVNTPTSNIGAVAEHAILLMLAVARRTLAAAAATRRRDTRLKYDRPMLSLHGKTLGVIGFGHRGRCVSVLAQGLGMQVVAWSPHAAPAAVESIGARHAATLDELLTAEDVVSLHRPMRADTRHTLDRDALALLKPMAIVVNTSRGGLIDEDALADALEEGRLFGAGLDVLAEEPLAAASRLASIDNVVLSPHVAGSTQEALRETARQCAAQVLDVLQNRRPASLVDPAVWERRRTFPERKPCP